MLERIHITDICTNNFPRAIKLPIMHTATKNECSTNIIGNYAYLAKAFGGDGERVTDPNEIIPAIKRGIKKTQEGTPVLLEFITSKETEVSRPGTEGLPWCSAENNRASAGPDGSMMK